MVCIETTARSATTLRRRDIGTVVPRSGGDLELRRGRRRDRRAAGDRGGSGDGGEHILLADASADTGAGDGIEVDALVVGELADDRGHVAGVGARDARRRGSRGLRRREPARRAEPAREPAAGSGAGVGSRLGGRCRRGSRRRLRAAAARARLRAPARRRAARCEGSVGTACSGVGTGASAAARLGGGRGCRLRSGGGLGEQERARQRRGQPRQRERPQRPERPRQRRGLGGGRPRRELQHRTASVTDRHERGADLDGLVLGDQDRLDHAGDRRRDLGVDLVGGDLEQRLVDLDAVADLLQPAGDRAFRDALAECRETDGFAHGCSAP